MQRGGPARAKGAPNIVHLPYHPPPPLRHNYSTARLTASLPGTPPRGRLGALRLAALAAALAVGLGLVLSPSPSSAQQPGDAASASADAGTIATTLYPGWNAAAWLGPDASAEAIFGAAPGIVSVAAWDAAEQAFRYAGRGDDPPRGLELTRGTGLYLLVGGAEPVTWTRPAAAGSVLLELREGWNLAGWTGPDGAPAAGAFARFGQALDSATRPAAGPAGAATYLPRSPDRAGALRELRRGDALWVRLTADARWWQPGAGPHPVAFVGDVAAERQAAIRGWADAARAAFAGRWSVDAAFEGWAGDRASLAARHLELRGAPMPGGFCADYADGAVLADADCAGAGDWARAYFGALQDALSGGRAADAPAWLVAGTAAWAGAVAAPGAGRTAEQQLARERRLRAEALPEPVPALADLAAPEALSGQGAAGEDLAFLAADWLAGRAGERSVAAFFEALADPAATWEEAFESAFGMTAEDFHAAFDPPAPRAAPDDGAPGIEACDRQVDTTTVTHEFPGAVSEADRARIRRMVDEAREVYARRWCVEASFANYAGEGSALAAKYLEVRGLTISDPFCGDYLYRAVFVNVDCISEHTYPHEYFHVLQDAVRGDADQHVATWLIEGTAVYAQIMQRGAVSGSASERLERYLAGRIEVLGRIATPSLAALDDPASAYGTWGSFVHDMGFVATHRLVSQSVEVAIVDVFARLADPAATWEEAFAGAFGVTVGDFYAAFEQYRAEYSATITKPDGTYWVRGVVRKQDGTPLVGAFIGADDGSLGDWEDETFTGTDGAFVLALPDGNYQPGVWLSGTTCPHSTSFTVSGADVSGVVIQLPAGSPCA